MRISLGMFQSLFFIIPFLMMINGEIGWIMLYALVAAHLISLVIFLISVRNFKIEPEVEFMGVHDKGDCFCLNVTVSKTGFCLLSDICLVFRNESDDERVARVSLIGRNSVTVRFRCDFDECGMNKFWLSGWEAADILRFIGKSKELYLFSQAAVLPELKPYDDEPLTPKLIPDEQDEEQEEANRNALFGGVPGYEYRGYEAGDSPRKINYKLSAKRHEIMVRRDENTVSGTTRILIKSSCYPDSAELALSMAAEIVSKGGAAEIFHCGDSYRAATAETVEKLREWLAFRSFPGTPVEGEDKLSEQMDYVIEVFTGGRVIPPFSSI